MAEAIQFPQWCWIASLGDSLAMTDARTSSLYR